MSETMKQRDARNGAKPDYLGMVAACVHTPGLVHQFERLTGHKIGSGDAASQAFARFVYDTVWTRGPWFNAADVAGLWASTLPAVRTVEAE
jgi:hypothetical protein